MTVHEEIHQAAETLRARARAAERQDGPFRGSAEISRDDAAYIALMGPTVGRELATLLARAAHTVRHAEDISHASRTLAAGALEVARAINAAGGSRE